jgi:hypothetical protein
MTTTTELETAKDQLISLLSETDTIYTVLRSVSKSGLSRVISFHIVYRGAIIDLNYYIGAVLDYKPSKARGGLRVKGCGMDMGFHAVTSLLRELGMDKKIKQWWI